MPPGDSTFLKMWHLDKQPCSRYSLFTFTWSVPDAEPPCKTCRRSHHALVSLHFSMRSPRVFVRRRARIEKSGSSNGSRNWSAFSRSSAPGFSLMDNHLHLLLRLDPAKVETWSGEEVALCWFDLYPLRDAAGKAMAVTKERLARFAAKADWVAEMRRRLADLGWFMKCLKEPLARRANKEDGCTGAFLRRDKSIAVMDEESLLATAAYIDLNPVAAGLPRHLKSQLTRPFGRESATASRTAAWQRYVTRYPFSHATTPKRPGFGCCPSTTIDRTAANGRVCMKASRSRVTCGWLMQAAEDRAGRRALRPTWAHFPAIAIGSTRARIDGCETL